MFLPLGDSPNPRGFTPWVNYALLAANIAVFLIITLPLSRTGVDPSDPRLDAYLRILQEGLPPGATVQSIVSQISAYDLFVFEYGFKPAAPELTDILTSMFLHGGFMHLFGNMLFLWIYGDNVEHRLGRGTYLAVYLGTGAVATLAFALFSSSSMTPLVGASGAISGVLGLYFLMFPKNQVKVFVFLFPFIFDVFWVRARWVLGFYILIDNILPFVSGLSSNVAYGAHIGGFLAGLGVAWFFEARGREKPAFDVTPAPASSEVSPELIALQADLQAGRIDWAVRHARYMDPHILAKLDPKDLYVVARALAEVGSDERAARALRKALSFNANSPSCMATIHLGLGELRLAQGQPTAAYQHLLQVQDLAPGTPESVRAEAALRALSARGVVTNRW